MASLALYRRGSVSFFLLAWILSGKTHAFMTRKKNVWSLTKSMDTTRKPLKPIEMVGSFFGGSNKKKDASLPRDVKEAVSNCRTAVQEALGQRLSRMDIEMPVGTKFGIEKASGGKRKKSSVADEGEDGVSKDTLDTSDRELARIFVEMFQPLGGDHIVTVFNEEELAETARKRWKGDPSASCRIVSVEKRKSSRGKKKKKAKGFAAMMEEELSPESSGPFRLPAGTELALFVAPREKELIAIERICSEVGMDTLVVLLNARLGRIESFATAESEALFMKEFEQVFHLGAAPQQDAPGCLMYRSYPEEWVLARKPKVGQPKKIMSQKTRPTSAECREAYQSLEIDNLEKGLETALESVANWLN